MTNPGNNAEQQAKLLQVLIDWQNPKNDRTPLTTLRLFRQVYQGDVAQALIHVLERALAQLQLTHPEHAAVLRSRLLSGEKIDAALSRLHLAEATFHRKRKEGLPLLAAALVSLEQEAAQVYRTQMLQRLEAPTYTHLISVAPALATLTTVLWMADAPWLVAITGQGGIGKTTLADALLRHLIDDPHWQGIGWVTARPTFFNAGGSIAIQPNPLLTTHGVLEALATQLLGDRGQGGQRSQAETLAVLERLLKAGPHLIVIDNLESVVDLINLLPLLRRLANPTKFLITTRVALFAEADLYHWVTPELNEADALALVRDEATLRHIPVVGAATDDALRPIYATVGGNPLALKLVTSQLRIHALDIVLADLIGARTHSVEALYTYLYQRAWDLLDETAQDLLLAMPLVSEQGGRLALLATITELPAAELRTALDTLVTLNLVEVRGDLQERHYTIHSLTRAFLHEQVLRWR